MANAIVNNYVDANVVAGKLATAALLTGSKVKHITQSFAVALTDLAGSIYRFVKGLSPDAIITSCTMRNDALTGASSANVGLYGVLDYDLVGAVVGSGNQLMTATDISAGTAISAAPRDCMTNVAIADREKTVYELAGHTQSTKLPAYDVALKLTNLTTGASGNVHMTLSYVDTN